MRLENGARGVPVAGPAVLGSAVESANILKQGIVMVPENNTEYVRIHLVLQVCLDSETGNVRPIVLELRTQSMYFSGKLSWM
ncbi:hypothetical protein MC885_006796, partial [Smutsia gigantea]